MKNKLKNHCIIFRSLVFYLIIFLQSCTSHIERRKNAEQEHCDVDKTLSAKPYFSGDEDNIFSNGEFKQFREFRSSVQKDFKLITSTAFDHVTEHAFADLLKEGAIFTAASSLGPVGLTVYSASKVVDFALSLPALKDQLENIIENYDDISHETKVETGTKLACDFIIGSLLKSGNNVSSNDTLRMCVKDEIKRVANMYQFFEKSDFGKRLKSISSKTNKEFHNQRIFKVTEKNTLGLSKGDRYYLDGHEKNHLEVFNSNGTFNYAIDLDGKINEYKSKRGIGRTIDV